MAQHSIDDIITKFRPISLEQMSGIKLMNRTDTKFVTSVPLLCQLLELAHSQYFVQDIDGVRISPYYTAYFDTADYAMYTMHQNGHTGRQKVRIRSYVSSHLNFLEVKTKNNHGRTRKKRVAVEDFDPVNPRHDIVFRRQNEQFVAYDDFLRKHLMYAPDTLLELLENRFDRITLVNEARTERLTIDTNLRFHNLANDRRHDLTGLAIIELKRDGLVPSPILELLRQLRIKPHGFSKYCMGQAFTNPNLKTNRFKERLRSIERILAQAQ